MSRSAVSVDSPRGTPSARTLLASYAAMAAVVAALLATIRIRSGAPGDAVAAVASAAPAAAEPHRDVLMHVLLALSAIILLGRWLGKLFRWFGQPRVIGEIVAGIVLGPSLLGRVWPEATAYLLPHQAEGSLRIIAELGVILYMFLIGLELNAEFLRSQVRATALISHAGIVVPWALGVVLALGLYPKLAPAGVPLSSFALFMGVALAITAFPVLARILSDRGMTGSDLGVMALGCAAMGDVTAWCLLALVVGVVQATIDGAVQTLLLAAGFVVVMLLVVRPLVVRYFGHHEHKLPQRRTAVWVLMMLLASSLAAQWAGIHAIFGAFLLGAVIPHDSDVARDFQHKLEDIVKILMLPGFFAYNGMRTEIGLVSGWRAWGVCGLIILAATVGKFGGTLVGARLAGIPWRMAAALGVLMNTRGLMELIVLNIGLELGVISPELFAMMVIMALVTTMATTPLLHALTGAEAAPSESPR